MELVSIIVPVYNVQNYLAECVDSILGSKYVHIEIILVDDGSSDKSGQICDNYKRKDKRIKVIHQENQGAAAARNAGLQAALGTYVCFVDSDDVISEYLVGDMLCAMEETNSDLVGCNYCREKSRLLNCSSTNKIYYCVDSFDELVACLVYEPNIRTKTQTSTFIWNKMYKKSKIEKLFQTEIVVGEDLQFNFDYIRNCKRGVFLSENYYYYRDTGNSIMSQFHKGGSPEIAIHNVRVWEGVLLDGELYNEELINYIKTRVAYMYHGVLRRVIGSGESVKYAALEREARQFISENFMTLRKDSELYSNLYQYSFAMCHYAYPLWKCIWMLLANLQVWGRYNGS